MGCSHLCYCNSVTLSVGGSLNNEPWERRKRRRCSHEGRGGVALGNCGEVCVCVCVCAINLKCVPRHCTAGGRETRPKLLKQTGRGREGEGERERERPERHSQWHSFAGLF